MCFHFQDTTCTRSGDLNVLFVVFQTKCLCYCHESKTLGFNGLVSPHEGRVQGGFQLGAVEVVFDQLLSAWLGVYRWANYTHTCAFTVLLRRDDLLPDLVFNPNFFKVHLHFPPQTKIKQAWTFPLQWGNGITAAKSKTSVCVRNIDGKKEILNKNRTSQ